MEQIECFETSVFNNQKPGKYAKDYTQVFSKLRHSNYTHGTRVNVRHSNSTIYHFILVTEAVLTVIWIIISASHISDKWYYEIFVYKNFVRQIVYNMW
jgi:hypothetical protein